MEQVNIDQLKEKLAADENIILLDVREPDERAEFNIGGIFLPLGNIMSMQTDAIEDHKDDEIICYCRSGQRSMQACLMLETMGYKNVKNLSGGMSAWREKFVAGN
ncbi:MAG: rhodanese-like domain-containing protein [Ferruginibacter sp.]